MGSAKWKHEFVKSSLNRLLVKYCDSHSTLRLMPESMFRLTSETDFIPDLSIVIRERVRGGSDYPFGAPEIAVEVVSSETAARLQKKVHTFFGYERNQYGLLILTKRP